MQVLSSLDILAKSACNILIQTSTEIIADYHITSVAEVIIRLLNQSEA